MATYLTIDLPSSCQQNWNDMAPADSGKFCDNCQKNVVDFTAMSDAELAQYFSKLKTPTCGRFTQAQLQREIPIPRKPLPWLKYLVQISIPAFLFSLKAGAQIPRSHPPVETLETKPVPNHEVLVNNKLQVTGIVSDEKGNPLNAATVLVKGSQGGVLSDSSGRFLFTELDQSAVLVFSYVGYETKELAVVRLTDTVIVHMTPVSLEEIVFVGYAVTARSRRKKQKDIKRAEISAAIKAYPNPIAAGTRLSVQCRSMEQGKYSMQLSTLFGQLLQSEEKLLQAKQQEISINTDQLKSGTYVLTLQHQSTGKVFSQQIVVSK